MNKLLKTAAVAVIFATTTAGAAQAAGTITNSAFTVGIGNNGELFDFNSGIGFRRNADGYDPLQPGTPRDSWGVATASGSAWADQTFFGANNITGTAFGAFGGATTTALTTTSVGVTVAQSYKFVAPNILRIDHSITNTGTSATNILFQRNWDLEVSPTQFNENSFWPASNPTYPLNFVDSTYSGFENPDPSVAYGASCINLTCNFGSDLGGGIKIGFGNVAAGDSVRFSYWYGINSEPFGLTGGGQNVDQLIAQGISLGAVYQIATQSSENGLHPNLGSNSAFIGIGNVPEPGTWAMLIAGFGLVGAAARRRRTAVAA